MRLKFIEDGGDRSIWYGGLISGPTDWPIHMFVILRETEKYDREWALSGRYHAELVVSAPQAVSPKVLQGTLSSHGMTMEQWEALSEDLKAQLLIEYGAHAILWQMQGDDSDKLLVEASGQTILADSLFGFFMDKPQNRIGDTGWDFIKGELGSAKSRNSQARA